jgi:hypothetical protein
MTTRRTRDDAEQSGPHGSNRRQPSRSDRHVCPNELPGRGPGRDSDGLSRRSSGDDGPRRPHDEGHQVEDLREIAPPGSPESADILARMTETYDPATQAVVMAAIDGQNPISIKLRLEPPNLVDDPGGVQ